MFLFILGMGTVLSVIIEALSVAGATGATLETVLSGEIFSLAELLGAEVTNLVLLDGYTFSEALAIAGISAEAWNSYEFLALNFPSILAGVAGTETTAGLVIGSAVTAALWPSSFDQSVPIANMALQIWVPNWDDIFFPGVVPLTRFLNQIDPLTWASDLFHAIGRAFWQTAQREGQRLLEYEATRVAHSVTTGLTSSLAGYFENARWAVSQFHDYSKQAYASVSNYYSQLPSLKPPQIRALTKRLEENQQGQIPNHYENYGSPTSSGEYVEKYGAPGGANQRHAPDWMLPLLLGLYGDIYPSWDKTLTELEEEEDGPKKKKPRKSIRKA